MRRLAAESVFNQKQTKTGELISEAAAATKQQFWIRTVAVIILDLEKEITGWFSTSVCLYRWTFKPFEHGAVIRWMQPSMWHSSLIAACSDKTQNQWDNNSLVQHSSSGSLSPAPHYSSSSSTQFSIENISKMPRHSSKLIVKWFNVSRNGSFLSESILWDFLREQITLQSSPEVVLNPTWQNMIFGKHTLRRRSAEPGPTPGHSPFTTRIVWLLGQAWPGKITRTNVYWLHFLPPITVTRLTNEQEAARWSEWAILETLH